MTRYTIRYGDSTVGYSRATAVTGPRGGIIVTTHDGDSRRVTRAALAAVIRAHRAGESHLSLITTADDYLPVQVEAM